MSNKYVNVEMKNRMKRAGHLSKFLGGQCSKYFCPILDKKSSNNGKLSN